MSSLAGRVVVIASADTESGVRAARALAARRADLVLVGTDQECLGALARGVVETYGVQVAIFVGDPGDDALAEMVAELFTET